MEGLPTIVLETQRLILRRLTLDDLDALAELYHDPEVRRYFPEGTLTREETKEELEWIIDVLACTRSCPPPLVEPAPTCRVYEQTCSARWLVAVVSTVTTPRSGLLDDSRLSSTVVSA